MVDPNNRTRWKHKWWLHNRVSSEWVGDEDWIATIRMDMRDFVTFTLMNLKHSVVHRPQTLENASKADKEREAPRKEVPPDTTVSVRSEGTNV